MTSSPLLAPGVARRHFESSLADNKMRCLVERYGVLNVEIDKPFCVLARSVIAQQICTKAADTVRFRIEEDIGLEPASIAHVEFARLRRFGLSEAKARCLREIAVRAQLGEFEGLSRLSDQEVGGRLLAIRGVGPWTVAMFLIFGLRRGDIWPTGDAGLRAAALKHYRITSTNGLIRLGRRFRPYRSFAARYLWKSLENAR